MKIKIYNIVLQYYKLDFFCEKRRRRSRRRERETQEGTLQSDHSQNRETFLTAKIVSERVRPVVLDIPETNLSRIAHDFVRWSVRV